MFSPSDLYIPNHVFLYRMQKAGIPCPTVVLLKKHILVMSFIGHDQVPAPKLKEVKLSSEEMKDAYHQTLHVSCAVWFLCTDASVHFFSPGSRVPVVPLLGRPRHLSQLFKVNLGTQHKSLA